MRRWHPQGKTKKPANDSPAFLFGAPGEIRTPDPQVRSLVLYPAELRAQKRNCAEPKAIPSIIFVVTTVEWNVEQKPGAETGSPSNLHPPNA
jgi:hypothetical protein